jgi:hypothetical protein
VNCRVKPLARLGFEGVTAIDDNAAAVTVSTVEPFTPFRVAMIVEGPVASPVAKPALVMVATERVSEDHVTSVVKFCVELSVNVPVAVNCWARPLARLGFEGVTAIETNAAAVTVSTVEPFTPFRVAEIVEGPVATPVAKPAAVMVATDCVPEDHVTWLVKSCVE